MVALAFTLLGTAAWSAQGVAPRLRVSDNRRFLVKEDGSPFFYLGDTAWELFHRLDREEAERYLKNRAAKRFTVIQAVVLAELNGLKDFNAYGQLPLKNDDPAQPNEEYFRHVDWVVDRAEALGLFIGMLPTWGDKWHKAPDQGGIFTPENAGLYGEWLARRYKDKAIIWILGGDRPVENDRHRAVLTSLAQGLRRGDGGQHLITFHPPGGQNSAKWFHGESWLDFNMWQNGHGAEVPVWDRITQDYQREPVKPVMDGEPIYEDHPIAFNAREKGHSNAADVRRFLYWDLFAGAHGHTYGNHAVWQMWATNRQPINGPLHPWYEAIDRPGAGQMQHARALLESRPYLIRVPDQSLIVPSRVPTWIPGAGLKRLQATRGSDGAYAFIYLPASTTFTVNLEKLSGERLKAWWYNPRTGSAQAIGEFPRTKMREFTPPDLGENIDWVLVLDDASKGFGPPGAGSR